MGIAISLNFITFLQAIPETQRIDSGCCAPKQAVLAKDFSAFYFAAWNLIHDPSAIYSIGSTQNVSFLGIYPHPETFKYLPSFLIFVAPLLVLSYAQALDAFDLIQFVLLILIAFLIYNILERENIAFIGIVSVIALLLPFSTVMNWGISEAYFWQWAEAQSKVLELVLILLSLFFGMRKRPALSGIFFGLSFFDPRFSLVAIPLFLTLNQGRIAYASIVATLTLVGTNIPIIALPGVASGFFQMLLTSGVTTPLYYYSYIPLLTVVALSVAKWKDIAMTFNKLFGRKSQMTNRTNLAKSSTAL